MPPSFFKKALSKIKRYILFINAKKIVIGSANIPIKGWLLTDKETLDVTDRNAFLKYWKPSTRSSFLSEHVWEHLSPTDSTKALKNCFEFLRSGGRLRIAVPDGFHPDSAYIESVRPGGTGIGSDDHKILYNYLTLSDILKQEGFRIVLLEYWDEHGKFNYKEWSSSDGHIFRSKRYDPRNQDNSLSYTSLIIDAIKP